MLYSIIKFGHALSLSAWVLGLLVLSSVTGFAPGHRKLASLERMASWNDMVVLPAMGLTWCMGLMMGGMQAWFGTPWLDIKLVLAGVLTLLHLWQSHVLRIMIRDADYRAPGWMGLSGAMVFLMTALIITLAAAKPFS